YSASWPSWHDFELFLATEQSQKIIELRMVENTSSAERYQWKTRYVCSRSGTGGNKNYAKKNPAWSRKIPSKRTDCPCSLTVKTYHNTKTVLGHYRCKHNHDLGSKNLCYTQI
ncbi:hypothetical protein FPV67DRAFT_1392016, partial [Lyophyllum atratum]